MKVLWVAISLTMVLAFQNCAKSEFAPADAVGAPEEKPIDDQDAGLDVTEIVQHHFPASSLSFASDHIRRLSVSLQSGQVVVERSEAERTCLLGQETLEKFRSLFQDAKMCDPIIREAEVRCMAIGIPDIDLRVKSGELLNLQPIVCGSGFDLCGEKSRELRQELRSLAQNLPEGC